MTRPTLNRRTARRLLPAALLVVAALLAAGCGAVGRVTSGDPSQGKAIFKETCGGCHTLADAGTSGTIGPNLDDAFSSDKAQGFSQQTMKDVIRGQIAYPDPAGAMRANLVTGAAANSVATYIAQCSGNPSCGVTAATAAPATTTTTTTSGTMTGTTTTATSTPATTTGSGGGASVVAAGKAVFESAGCAGCHTLKDANASGKVGPNLDQLKPSEAIVAHQVEVGGGPMPSFKGQLTAAQITAVATYVSSVAGK